VQKVLISGPTGFIGTYTTKLLRNSFVVYEWDSKNFGSILDTDRFHKVLLDIKPDIFVHLAWESTKGREYDQSPAHEIWSIATTSIAQICLEMKISPIIIGSALDKHLEHKAISPYASAKSSLRRSLSREIENKEVTWVTPQYIFSIEEKKPRVMNVILDALASDSEPIFSSPLIMHDFIEVRDVATGINAIARHGIRGETYLGSEIFLSVNDFYNAIARNLGKAEEADTENQISSLERIVSDFILPKDLWTPEYTFATLGYRDL
jgi:nucleoside-diphosphate-sugar epimerase